jgi:hypothetical protein
MDPTLVQLYNGLKQNTDPINATYSINKQYKISYIQTSNMYFKIMRDIDIDI